MVIRLAGGLLVVVFFAMDFLRQGAIAKRVIPAASTDRGTSLLILVAYVFSIIAIASPRFGSVPLLAPSTGWLGVGVGIVGFVVRLWAMLTLGPFYTRTLVTTENQRVVRSGPYRWVRHPGYLGSILLWSGAATTSTNIVAIATVFVLLAVAYTHRIRTEERMLVEALGRPYVDYQRESWRLVPFVF